MKTGISSSKWFLKVYCYQSDIPSGSTLFGYKPTDVVRNYVSSGITSVKFSSSKSNIESDCTVTFAGDVPTCIFVGNWTIVCSQFNDTVMPKMIGQIVGVNHSYAKDASGAFRRISTVTIRKWSFLLHAPIRFDYLAIQQQYATNLSTQVSEIAIETGDIASEIAKTIFVTWQYVGIVLKWLGALNKNTQLALEGYSSLYTQGSEYTFSGIVNKIGQVHTVASKLPKIPKELLDDIGARGATPDNPYTGSSDGDGFMTVCVGSQTKKIERKVDYTETYIEDIDTVGGTYGREQSYTVSTIAEESFDGFFKDENELKNIFDPTTVRPSIYNIAQDFTLGSSAWELINSKLDPSIHDIFADMWYIKQGDTIYARPVFVIRDKPFAIKSVIDMLSGGNPLKSQWTIYDDIPRVYIDNVYISRVEMLNTFVDSPNFFIMNFKKGQAAVPTEIINARESTRYRDDGAIDRFGTINYFPLTEWLATFPDEFGTVHVDGNWYKDIAILSRAWYAFDYRMLRGTMTLFDHNIPIMVGMNITWKIGLCTLCAHVESISWNHIIDNMTGRRSTTCNVQFSHCVLVAEDKSLGLLTPSQFNNIFEEESEATYSFEALPNTGIGNDMSDYFAKEAEKAAAVLKATIQEAEETATAYAESVKMAALQAEADAKAALAKAQELIAMP